MGKSTLVKLGILLMGAGLVGVLLLQGVDLRAWIDEGIALVQKAGPWVFFTSMAVLPAVGSPLSPFTLTAGSIFAPTLGWPLVIVATWLALTVNVTITYVGARWLARPLLEKLVLRLGYRWPEVRPENHWDVTILARVTPGPPFVLKGAMLGLARIPFRIYLLGSVLIEGIYATVFVVFGEALLAGRGKMIVVGISALAALAVGTHLLRGHLARKKAQTEQSPSSEEA